MEARPRGRPGASRGRSTEASDSPSRGTKDPSPRGTARRPEHTGLTSPISFKRADPVRSAVAQGPAWATRALGVVTGVTLLLLLVQYMLGLWTADYAPASFTDNTSYPSLDWHYNVGFILGFLSIIAVVVAVLTRRARLIAPAVVLLLSVVGAGVMGMRFVGTTPNDPLASFVMGVLFLVAFGSAMGLMTQLGRARGWMGRGASAASAGAST